MWNNLLFYLWLNTSCLCNMYHLVVWVTDGKMCYAFALSLFALSSSNAHDWDATFVVAIAGFFCPFGCRCCALHVRTFFSSFVCLKFFFYFLPSVLWTFCIHRTISVFASIHLILMSLFSEFYGDRLKTKKLFTSPKCHQCMCASEFLAFAHFSLILPLFLVIVGHCWPHLVPFIFSTRVFFIAVIFRAVP